MTEETNHNSYLGGCHCGGIRFRVIIKSKQAIWCNCSICRKKAIIHYLVSPQDFTLLQGEELLSTYRFNTRTAQHHFCKICGIHPFYIPRSHPDKIDVNLRCLDEDIIDQFSIQGFDGQNWEANIHHLRK